MSSYVLEHVNIVGSIETPNQGRLEAVLKDFHSHNRMNSAYLWLSWREGETSVHKLEIIDDLVKSLKQHDYYVIVGHTSIGPSRTVSDTHEGIKKR